MASTTPATSLTFTLPEACSHRSLLAHVFIETPYQQYDVWATGASHLPHAMGQPNLLHLTSPALGVAAAALSILLSVLLLATVLSFLADARDRGRS